MGMFWSICQGVKSMIDFTFLNVITAKNLIITPDRALSRTKTRHAQNVLKITTPKIAMNPHLDALVACILKKMM